jgi:hypothetical protein
MQWTWNGGYDDRRLSQLQVSRAFRRIAGSARVGEDRFKFLKQLPPGLRQHIFEKAFVFFKVVLSSRKGAGSGRRVSPQYHGRLS